MSSYLAVALEAIIVLLSFTMLGSQARISCYVCDNHPCQDTCTAVIKDNCDFCSKVSYFPGDTNYYRQCRTGPMPPISCERKNSNQEGLFMSYCNSSTLCNGGGLECDFTNTANCSGVENLASSQIYTSSTATTVILIAAVLSALIIFVS